MILSLNDLNLTTNLRESFLGVIYFLEKNGLKSCSHSKEQDASLGKQMKKRLT